MIPKLTPVDPGFFLSFVKLNIFTLFTLRLISVLISLDYTNSYIHKHSHICVHIKTSQISIPNMLQPP